MAAPQTIINAILGRHVGNQCTILRSREPFSGTPFVWAGSYNVIEPCYGANEETELANAFSAMPKAARCSRLAICPMARGASSSDRAVASPAGP
jgi:hypothetical protein